MGFEILITLLIIVLAAFSNSKVDEAEKEMMKEGITGKSTAEGIAYIFLANQDNIIAKGKIGREYIRGTISFSDFDDYNDLHITKAIEIARHNSDTKVFNRKERCILEALENLQDNLAKLQLDDKDEN